jgi:hypothetical protein
MALLNFDATNVQPLVARSAIPAGWYPCVIQNTEMKTTKAGTGQFLEVSFEVQQPSEHAKALLFGSCNLANPNPVAVEIGYRTLSSICHAVGIIQVADSSQLHGRPLMVKVSLRPAGPGADGNHYEATNEIKDYKAYENTAPAFQAPARAFPPAAAPAFPPEPAGGFPQPTVAPSWNAPAPVQQPSAAPDFVQPGPALQFQQPVQQPAPAAQQFQQPAPAPAQQQAAEGAPANLPPWMKPEA